MAGSSINIKFEKFQHNWPGYRAIMMSSEVQGILLTKANRIRQAIEPEINDDEWDVVVSPWMGRTRARVMVSGVPLWLEKQRGVLGSAIDAGKGG